MAERRRMAGWPGSRRAVVAPALHEREAAVPEDAMQTKGDDTNFDPICGKRVDPLAAQTLEYKKRKYFFCSGRCRERFERQAERHRVHDLARMGALFAHQKVRWGVA
jgi:YHS domain-containing protein